MLYARAHSLQAAARFLSGRAQSLSLPFAALCCARVLAGSPSARDQAPTQRERTLLNTGAVGWCRCALHSALHLHSRARAARPTPQAPRTPAHPGTRLRMSCPRLARARAARASCSSVGCGSRRRCAAARASVPSGSSLRVM